MSYAYRLLLEDRTIDILAYNVETVLAEKIETMLARSTLNTRMRDFYDMWVLTNTGSGIDHEILADAVAATIDNRDNGVSLDAFGDVLDALAASETMRANWERYRDRNDFASDLQWDDALSAARSLCEMARRPE